MSFAQYAYLFCLINVPLITLGGTALSIQNDTSGAIVMPGLIGAFGGLMVCFLGFWATLWPLYMLGKVRFEEK